MRTVTVTTASAKYPVTIGSGLLDSLPGRLRRLFGPGQSKEQKQKKRIYVLTSPEIWSLWGRRLLGSLEPAAAAPPVVLFLPSGERYKRFTEVERLASELACSGADRASLLIAFGGGVVGDVGGFLAAIYMRGIDYIQIPTTFLAQVDSSVGGKTGVNLRVGKNLIGCFHHPRAVFADVDLLDTLPQRELRAGLYESVKTGLIRDRALFRYIEDHLPLIDRMDRRDRPSMERIVASSVRVKAQVVSLDERESGLRMILNFGHTMGHAIEAAAGFGAMLHGEAVAWGMRVALAISATRTWLKPGDAERAERVIRFFDPPELPRLSPQRLLETASKDKKNRSGVRRFVLLRGIGRAVVAEDVSDAEILAALGSVLNRASDSGLERSGRGRGHG